MTTEEIQMEPRFTDKKTNISSLRALAKPKSDRLLEALMTGHLERPIKIEPRSAAAFVLRTGERLRIIDETGGQPGDLVAFNAQNLAERFSQSRTRVENQVYRVTKGHELWSNTVPPKVMLTVTDDSSERHDLLYTPCNRYALKKRFGLECDGCQEHLAASLASWGIGLEEIPDPLNIFFNVTADPVGGMKVGDQAAKPGLFIKLRAEMDCVVAISTCSAPIPGRDPSGFALVFN